jgi:hypothetical protein
MHPTADTAAVISGIVAGRRVMPGVRLLQVEKGGGNRNNADAD